MWSAFQQSNPEIVIHLAAQPIVREGYRDPVGTYSTNVMGTVHILECIRRLNTVRSVLDVTTDKVYENRGWPWGYRETDRLNGFDPYANSKSCSELVTDSYRNSFLASQGVAVSTARAGNVIGGGDFAVDRIIPDCIRAAQAEVPIQVRNPMFVRPYQHVLEPLSAYLLIIQRQYEDSSLSGSYNVGPDNCDCLTTGELVSLFCCNWGKGVRWEHTCGSGPHEDAILKLDCSKIQNILGWRPKWNAEQAVAETVAWAQEWLTGNNMDEYTKRQIEKYFSLKSNCEG